MPKLTRDCLSEHDQIVLNSIFNPLQIGGDNNISVTSDHSYDVFNLNNSESKTGDNDTINLQDPIEEKTPENELSLKLEINAIQAAENGDLNKSLEIFENAIKLTPNRASLFNNRAQVYRLKGMDDDALTDLNSALQLTSNSGRTGCQALCQRGILYRKQNNLEAARTDFELAAKLGSKFARTQLVEINPYAALCNQMLRDAFQKLS